MALPIIGLAAKVVLGSMKVSAKAAIKKAIGKAAIEIASGVIKDSSLLAGKQTVKNQLERLAAGKISDAQILLINRLKSKATNATYQLASKELGISVSAVKDAVKFFQQSSIAKSLAKGRDFTSNLNEAVKNQKKFSPLQDFDGKITVDKINNRKPRKRTTKTADTKPKTLGYNAQVLRKLNEMQIALNSKIYGSLQATDKTQTPLHVNSDIIGFYSSDRIYTANSIKALEVIEKSLSYSFDIGSDESDVWVIAEGEGESNWAVYSMSDVKKFILDIRKDVEHFLDNTSSKKE